VKNLGTKPETTKNIEKNPRDETVKNPVENPRNLSQLTCRDCATKRSKNRFPYGSYHELSRVKCATHSQIPAQE
jgi:hypothetical protein